MGIKRVLVEKRSLLLIALTWVIAILIIDPRGEFPLNDDWAFSLNVLQFMENGILCYSSWPAMTLVSQTVLGAAFCKVVGFSFVKLRVLTLVLSVFTSYLIFFICKYLKANSITALFCTLFIVLNPVYLLQSFTFMTEIYFLFFSLLSIYYYLNYINTEANLQYGLAILFSVIALLVRQTGLIWPIAFGIVWSIMNRGRWKALIMALMPIVICSIVLFVFKTARFNTTNVESNYVSVSTVITEMRKYDIILIPTKIGMILYYVSLFLLPISLVLPFQKVDTAKRSFLVFVALACAMIICMLLARNTFPNGNLLALEGVGPRMIKGLNWGKAQDIPIKTWTIRILGAALILNMTVLLYYLFMSCVRAINNARMVGFEIDNKANRMKLFLLVSLIGYSIYLLLHRLFFDRYMIFLLVLSALLLAQSVSLNKFRQMGITFLLLIGMGTALLIKDYFAWNVARWSALDHLTETIGIFPSRIDGGFEFNGWYASDPTGILQHNGFMEGTDYVVSARPINGYHELKVFTCDRFLPLGVDTLLILEKDILDHAP